MGKSRLAAILLLLLGLGVSLALPAEDAPETPYDESETQPYEETPAVSIAPPLTSVRIAKAESSYGSELLFNPSARRSNREKNAESHYLSIYPPSFFFLFRRSSCHFHIRSPSVLISPRVPS
jgi:hypothetical protein